MTTTFARRAGAAALSTVAAAVLVAAGAGPAGAHPSQDNESQAHDTGNRSRDARNLADVRVATAKYQDVNRALADGYVPVSPCEEDPELGAMGVHYLNPTLAGDLRVDPKRPEVLLYLPKANGRMKLVGVEYSMADAGQGRPSVLGRQFDGPMAGHSPEMPTHYDLHLWIWRHNPAGVASAWNPAISCD